MKLPDAFSPDVMQALATPVQQFDFRTQQLVSGFAAKWYVAQVSGRDVEKELIKLRFGIYVPEENETVVVRGRPIERCVRMFPGYVFVFLWETDENWSTLANTRDVVAILGTLSDEQIDEIRVVENIYRAVRRERKPRRRRRGRRAFQHDVSAVSGLSPFQNDLMKPGADDRIQTLKDALVLPT